MGKPGSWKALPTFKPHSSPHFSPKIAFNGQTTCNLGFRPKKDQRTDFLFVEILELSLGLVKVRYLSPKKSNVESKIFCKLKAEIHNYISGKDKVTEYKVSSYPPS